MRTEDEMTEMAGNPLIRDKPAFSHREPSSATAHALASDQSARVPKDIYFIGPDHL